MQATPDTRARRAASREIEALAMHTPCLRRLPTPHRDRFKLAVDLPFLSWDSGAKAPRACRGFALGIELPRSYPAKAPRIAFFSKEQIFHPAISPRLATFCIGNGVWTPDVGLAHFVVLHLEAIVGLVDIDTLDGLFADELCELAAKHYRELREKEDLPLARPVFSTGVRPSGRALSAPSTRRSASEHRPSGMRAAVGITVGSPRGRRLVSLRDSLREDGASGAWTATCVLEGEKWGASGGPDAARIYQWFRDRIEGETELILVEMSGAPALQLRWGGLASPSGEELRSIFEPALRRLELPIGSLGDVAVANALAAALKDSNS